MNNLPNTIEYKDEQGYGELTIDHRKIFSKLMDNFQASLKQFEISRKRIIELAQEAF